MARRRKRASQPGEGQVIDLKSYQAAKEAARAEMEARVEYEDPEEAKAGKERERKIQLPKAAYRVAAILLALVLGLALWLNREALRPERLGNWIKLQFMGDRIGDGFPVTITGSQVSSANFTARDSDVLALTDTTLMMVDPTGKELLSLRHSLNAPVMRTAGGRTLLYNRGGVGYLVLSGTRVQVEGSASRDILCGAVAQNGRFALGLQGGDGATELNVYQADGSLQYHYLFAQDYITAIALNYDGSYGMVCAVRAQGGELVSRVAVFNFNEPEPLASYETRDNLLLDASWTEAGDLYALGESALLRAKSPEYNFTESGYEGRKPTAYLLDQGRVFLSLSAYEHAGPCTLLIFRGKEEPARVEFTERILSLSSSGGTVGALSGGEAVFLDWSTGVELGRVPVSADAKSLALASERLAYTLGVSEIREVELP